MCDNFLPENATLTAVRRLLGQAIRAVETGPNRRITDIIGRTADLLIESDELNLLHEHDFTICCVEARGC